MEIEELKIPVPWGHIAAKAWGNTSNYPIIVLHGIQDNAATFDHLIPHLPNNFYYVCIDLPGHGRSPTLKANLPLDFLDFCASLKMVLDYFQWKHCYALGHSMGGLILVRTAQLFPSYFRKIVLIDGAYTLPIAVNFYREYLVRQFNGIIKYEQTVAESREQPTYTYEEALKKVCDSRHYEPLAREKAEPILNRMIESVGGGKFRFSLDPKCKYVMTPLHDSSYAVDLIKNYPVVCPMLVIVDIAHDTLYKKFKPVLKVYETQKNVIVTYVPANHDMHITIPHIIGPFISRFLNKVPNSKL